MPIVNVYKYLGIYFSTKLSFSVACKDLASRAKHALIYIMHKLKTLDSQSFDVLMKVFDAQIQPIVQYGAELWGLDQSATFCERPHLYALKKFLGVSIQTPNDLVYGELNRYPIYINSALRCIRFWLKLTRMEEDRLPRKAYRMLLSLDEKGKINWVTKVRMKICESGFGHVWLNQGVEDINGFVHMFKQRLIDCRWQDWNRHMQESDRFNVYKMLNSLHEIPLYLHLSLCRQVKYILCKFRFGVSDLLIHKYRYSNSSLSRLTCPLCNEEQENEIHFVLKCPVLFNIRKQYIPFKYYKYPCMFRLILLMTTPNEIITRNFAIFLYKAFQFRMTLIDE